MKVETVRGATCIFLASAALAACDGGSGPAPASSAAPAASGASGASAASGATSAAAAPASASAKVETYGIPIGVPFPADKIVSAVNPKALAPYAGEKGTLKGTIRIEGDPPPDTGLKIDAKCKEGVAAYAKLFRIGLGKALADAMVVVEGYDAFVPAREEAEKVTIRGCAFAKRTVVATYGQRIEVQNLDSLEPYMPYLDSTPTKATMVAVPGGAPVKLYPHVVGRYMIRDTLPKDFMVADVFVLPYATHDVTGLDGKYEIKDIPVGKVRVRAHLPVISKEVAEFIEIKAGENTLDLTLKFDAKRDLAPPRKPDDKPPPPSGPVIR